MTIPSAAAPLTDIQPQAEAEAPELVAFDQSGAAHDDSSEPSLDEYFKSFMQRIGISEQRVETIAPTSKSLDVGDPRSSQKNAPKPTEKHDLPRAERRRTPGEAVSLTALREVAVSSARQAIGANNAKVVTRTYSDLMVAGCAVVLAMMLLAVTPEASSPLYVAAIVAIGTSLYFGVRMLRGVCLLGSFGAVRQ